MRSTFLLCGAALVALSVYDDDNPLWMCLGFGWILMAGLFDLSIKQLRLIQHQQEAEQGDT
jgi:hypothetical protein